MKGPANGLIRCQDPTCRRVVDTSRPRYEFRHIMRWHYLTWRGLYDIHLWTAIVMAGGAVFFSIRERSVAPALFAAVFTAAGAAVHAVAVLINQRQRAREPHQQ